jgi:hypothetical protein
VSFDLAAGTASYSLRNLPIPDYHDTPNALAGGPSEPAVASFDVRWMPGSAGRRFTQTDSANRFVGEYSEGISTITWSARQAGFEFVSDPSDASQSQFAIVGHERNGVYFDAPAAPTGPAPRSPGEHTGDRASLHSLPATGSSAVREAVAGGALALGGLGLWLGSRAVSHPAPDR